MKVSKVVTENSEKTKVIVVLEGGEARELVAYLRDVEQMWSPGEAVDRLRQKVGALVWG